MAVHDEKPVSRPVMAVARELPTWLALTLQAGLTLLMFCDVLFVHPRRVLSSGGMDLNYFFVHWRHFGFEELKAGRLALWNPHYYSGLPFFGGFQAALLYPLNFLYLLLPLEAAINWTIALHVFLAGTFTFFWARHRGLHSWACMLAAVMFMFCGPHFLQIYAGHLPNLCTLIWAPLLFLAIDQVMDCASANPRLAHAGAAECDVYDVNRTDEGGRRGRRPRHARARVLPGNLLEPCLLGAFAAAMAIFAGHPQYVFFLAVAAAVYCGLNLIAARERARIVGGLALIALGAVGLSAVQLLTGIEESGESMRSIGVSYNFASTYSLPPENLLTLIAPWFFGDMQECTYWGRWNLTELSVFVSVSGLMLALYGAARGKASARRFSVCLVLMALVLALGSYTPLFPLLYRYAPGFNKFRGFAKFIWLAALFLSMLAAVGLDALLKEERVARWLVALSITSAIALMVVGLWLPHARVWPAVLKSVQATHQTELPDPFVEDPAIIAETNSQAAQSLFTAAVSFGALGLLLVWSRLSRNAACAGIVILATVELCAFAGHSLTTFQIIPPYPARVANFLKEHPGDYRIFGYNPNAALTAGTQDIWGDDPSGLLRYVRFLAFTQGYNFDQMNTATRSSLTSSAAWGLLRCRFVLNESTKSVLEVTNILPHLLLAGRCRVLTNDHEILSTLTNSAFPRSQEVILETRPDPWPQAQPVDKPGSVRLVASSTDTLTIEATVAAPALLLITDAYSKGWRATALPGSAQSQYQILPADYCLRAIPLRAGRHRIEMEYSPWGFRIGKWVSLVSIGIFAAGLIYARIKKRTLNRR